MNDSNEELRDILWLKVEMLTGTKFFCRENPPVTSLNYSDEANYAIDELQELDRNSIKQNECQLDYWLMLEPGSIGYMFMDKYQWKVKISQNSFG